MPYQLTLPEPVDGTLACHREADSVDGVGITEDITWAHVFGRGSPLPQFDRRPIHVQGQVHAERHATMHYNPVVVIGTTGKGLMMSGYALRKPLQVRLPLELHDYVAEMAREHRESKTDVVIEALNCLREQQVDALMEEGYRELAGSQRDLISAGLTAALPMIPR